MQMLDGLPNCVFDSSGPLRQYTRQARVGSFFATMAELSAVGAVAGTVTSLASTAAVELRKRADPLFEPSVPVPSVGRSSGGLAAFFALNANVRYQLVGGLDRYLFGHSSFLWTYLGLTGVARLGSVAVGEASRPFWQGLPEAQRSLGQQQVVRTKKVSKKVSRRVPKAAAYAAVEAAASMEEGVDSVSVADGMQPLEVSVSGQQVESAPAPESSSYGDAAGQQYSSAVSAVAADSLSAMQGIADSAFEALASPAVPSRVAMA